MQPSDPQDSWRTQAACAGKDPDIFFRTDGHIGDALTICNACPVRVECERAGARERFGVWGGIPETVRNRRVRRSVDA